jgi:Malic enzyme
MSDARQRREALVYHAKPQPGKIKIVPTKPYQTQRDLALAYSPGVAEPCLEIEKIRPMYTSTPLRATWSQSSLTELLF